MRSFRNTVKYPDRHLRVSENFQENITLASLSKALYAIPYTVSRIFPSAFRTNFTDISTISVSSRPANCSCRQIKQSPGSMRKQALKASVPLTVHFVNECTCRREPSVLYHNTNINFACRDELFHPRKKCGDKCNTVRNTITNCQNNP